MKQAEKDTGLQKDLYTACSMSLLFWINFAVFTYRKFRVDTDGIRQQCRLASELHRPFVTWEIQDKHILGVENAINTGYDLLTDKSRDMGATWNHIAVFHHQWLFMADRNFLEISRKEDCVDGFGASGESGSDPGTLFGKHDYINRWLPVWMLTSAHYNRKRLHLTNLRNQSRIDGESSNPNAGSSDRRTAILLDEMAKMREGEGIKRSTKDVTACRLANSTPDGPGTAFSKWRKSGQIKVFPLMYWDHPEKGRGRHVTKNTQYASLGPWLIRTPWFEQQEKERSPKEMAIDVLADHISSGDTFFEANIIEMHRKLFVEGNPVKTRWTIDFKEDVATEAVTKIIQQRQLKKLSVRRTSKGPLRMWPRIIGGRPDQTKSYIIGIDISKGQGASNSVLSIMCIETREKIGEWADANTPPYELARIACAVAMWVGGARHGGRPLMIWEANGPGWDFGRQIVKIYNYPNYFFDRPPGTIKTKRSKKYGWHSTQEKKTEALGVLRRAYAHNGFINHSAEALNEALEYIYYTGGGIGPASMTEESKEARKCHGDRVIGDMLCLWALEDFRGLRKRDGSGTKPPENSMAYRRLQRERLRKQRGLLHKDYFDHRQSTGDVPCLSM